MRAVVQRVSRACVRVSDREVARIGTGLLVYLGVEQGDGEAEATWLAEKIAHLRIFPDGDHSMNRSLLETGGEILSISQFTLASRLKKGRRPSFSNAMEPREAEALYQRFNGFLEDQGPRVKTGEFGALMEVDYVNYGPVTFILEKKFG